MGCVCWGGGCVGCVCGGGGSVVCVGGGGVCEWMRVGGVMSK